MTAILGLALMVGIGSALGGAARFFVSGMVARAVGETFPWGTMAVNVTGAVAVGMAWGLAEAGALFGAAEAWQFAVAGFLGSYTTVSSFSLQTLALIREGEGRRAWSNVLLSLVLGLGGVTAGLASARVLVAGW